MIEEANPLLNEIASAFPLVDIPPRGNVMSIAASQYPSSDDLLRDIEEFRVRTVSEELIRAVYLELHNLSAEGWSWILPYYLRYCLGDDMENFRTELEFLIYKLDPKKEFLKTATENLSLMSKRQIECLIKVVQWCMSDQHWSKYFPENLQGAMRFLQGLRKKKAWGVRP